MSKLLDQLISEFENREQRGLRKYGTSMDRTDLSFDEWLQHFKEELMDGLVYLQKIQNLYDTQRFPDYQEVQKGLQFIKNMARDAKFKYLTFASHRPGWVRRAKAYGFRPRKWICEV